MNEATYSFSLLITPKVEMKGLQNKLTNSRLEVMWAKAKLQDIFTKIRLEPIS